MKTAFHHTLDEAFHLLGEDLIDFKSVFLGLCIDIDRFLKIACKIDASGDADQEAFARALRFYPRFKGLTLDQFNRYLALYREIRDVSAHYHLSRQIALDKDLEEFILKNAVVSLAAPSYEGSLTVYGAVLALGMLAHKYMVWPFVTTFFKHRYLVEVPKKQVSPFLAQQQRFLNFICGSGKPVAQEGKKILDNDEVYINDTMKRTLTSVFFDLEIIAMNKKSLMKGVPSFKDIMKGSHLFDGRLLNRIIWLRNQWFHGTFIGDDVVLDERICPFTLELVLGILNDLLKEARKDRLRFSLLIKDLNEAAQVFFDFYALRMVEVSYKILDRKLLSEEKLESRLDNASFAYERMMSTGLERYEAIAGLRDEATLYWKVKPAKFTGSMGPRKMQTCNLRVLRIHCDSGFQIGEFKTERKDIVLASVFLGEGSANKVNGMDVSSLTGKEVERLSRFITVIDVTLSQTASLS